MGNKVTIYGDDEWMNDKVSKLTPVQTELQRLADKGAVYAREKLAQHTKTGRTRIEVSRGLVDRFVSMVHPWAVAIEYGHVVDGRYGPKNPNDEVHAEGIYVIRHAFQRMIGG